MAEKKYALDIFKTMDAIDRHDMGFLDSLPAAQQKGFASPVVLRWISASKNPQMAEWYLRAVNERANMHMYALYEYPDLHYRLLASCGVGRSGNHDYIKVGNTKRSPAMTKFLVHYWPDANDHELATVERKLREGDTLKDFLDGTGMSADESKRIRALFK